MRESGARPRSRPQTIHEPLARPRSRRGPGRRQAVVIRLKAPREGETVVDDRVQGRVVLPNKELDDLIILRSDGTPTYNLAVVVDDHDMGVTHVIRGVDHLTNAARQMQIYQAMGWDVPVFAHVPLIHGPDGAKLSKRHGALGIEAYRAMGYLPAALRNYLVRLGWSHGDDEIISTEQAIDWFDLDDINKSPAPARLRQARRRQRPLHPPGRATHELMPPHRGSCCPSSPDGAPTIAAQIEQRRLGPARRRAAAPQGARQDAGRAGRRRRLPARRRGRWRSTTRPPSCSTRTAARRSPSCCPSSRRHRTGRRRRWRRWCAPSPKQTGAEARQGRPAAARRAHRHARCRRRCSTSWPCSAARRRWRASATRPASQRQSAYRRRSALVAQRLFFARCIACRSAI